MRKLAFLPVAALLTLACDPIGPDATGLVSLGPGVDPAGYTVLGLTAFAETSTFDPAVAPEPLYRTWVPLAEASFPYSYQAGPGVGGSSTRDWRVVAWLSREQEPDWLAPGEPYGTAPYRAPDECFSDYCGVAEGVDLTIDQIAP